MHLEELPAEQAFLDNPTKATFLYLAPEILSNQGHGFETDFWSLGIMIYRMLVGEFPFGQSIMTDEENILETLSLEIQNKALILPTWLTSDAKILLKLLLNPYPF